MLAPRYAWRFGEPDRLSADLMALAADGGLSAQAVEVLARRGIVDPADLRTFAAADARTGLHDPSLLPDAGPLVERLRRARDRREGVLVMGDFDADGLTGMALLARALRACGLTVATYVPDRVDEGHGISQRAIETAATVGASLLITVDTGSSSVAEVEAASQLGIDVIVTDHHRVPDQRPAAVALVNPQRPDAVYPDRRLSGSGIALKVAQLAAAELLAMEPNLAAARLADLAVIGTVADVAPIMGENRSIARLGLERLRSQPRPGIRALLDRASIAPSAVSLETIAFAIAPRLNAAGRVGDARGAGELLMTEDAAEAARLADALEAANATRRDLLKSALVEARQVADREPDRRVVMVQGAWPIGILGLIAGRLADERARPAIVGAQVGDSIRASARGDGRLDLAGTLDGAADLLVRHGGHRGAAGFEVSADDWEALRERLEAAAVGGPAQDATLGLDVDLALAALDVDHRLLIALRDLEPTGPGNPAAVLAIEGLIVTRVRAASGGHAQVTLRRDVDVLDGIAFGRDDLVEALPADERVDVVGRLNSREFAGLETLQLEILDVATSGAHPSSPLMRSLIERRTAEVLVR